MRGATVPLRMMLRASWILGGVAIAVGALEYLWRPNITPPFTWLSRIGGVLLVVAVVWTALFAAKAGSRLPLIGLVLFVAGWFTLFVGIGAIPVAAGFGLYVGGLFRTRVVDRQALYTAVILVAAALPVAIVSKSSLAGIEIAAVAAAVTGLGVADRGRSSFEVGPKVLGRET